MTETWLLATLWLGLALLATLLSIWFGIATALSEIVVGTVAQLVIGALIGGAVLGANDPWIKFLSGTGAIILTFLAGAELDPSHFQGEMEGSRGNWPGKLRCAISRVCRGGLLCPALEPSGELACRRGPFHHFGCGGVRGNAGIWPQYHASMVRLCLPPVLSPTWERCWPWG